jgi:hypothetical protein
VIQYQSTRFVFKFAESRQIRRMDLTAKPHFLFEGPRTMSRDAALTAELLPTQSAYVLSLVSSVVRSFDQQRLCDCEIDYGALQTLGAHRVVLAASCPYFDSSAIRIGCSTHKEFVDLLSFFGCCRQSFPLNSKNLRKTESPFSCPLNSNASVSPILFDSYTLATARQTF